MNERLLEAYYVSAERRVLRRVVELSRLYGRDAEHPARSRSPQEISPAWPEPRGRPSTPSSATRSHADWSSWRAEAFAVVDPVGLAKRAR